MKNLLLYAWKTIVLVQNLYSMPNIYSYIVYTLYITIYHLKLLYLHRIWLVQIINDYLQRT